MAAPTSHMVQRRQPGVAPPPGRSRARCPRAVGRLGCVPRMPLEPFIVALPRSLSPYSLLPAREAEEGRGRRKGQKN